MGRARTAAEVSDLPWRLRHPAVVPLVSLVAASVLLLVVGVAAERRSTGDVLTSAGERVRSNRDAAIRALVRETDDRKRAAVALADASAVVDLLASGELTPSRAVEEALASLADSQGSPSAFVVDLTGASRATHPAQDELIGRTFAFRDWYRGVSRSMEPYVSSGYRSAATGRPYVVAVAAPVVSGRDTIGYVGVLWELESVRSISNGAKADDGVTIVVTDQDGERIVGRPVTAARARATSDPATPAAGRALDGVVPDRPDDGALAETGTVPDVGWLVSAEMSESFALRETGAFRRTLAATLLVALVLLLVATWLAYVMARRRAREAIVASRERTMLRNSEERFRRVFEEGLTGKLIVDGAGTILQANATMASVLGRARADIVDHPVDDLFVSEIDRSRVRALLGDDTAALKGEMQLHAAAGRLVWGLVATTWITAQNGATVLLVQVDDITGRREAEQKLTSMALHDELTGLPNRRLLLDRCEQAFAVARSGRSSGGWVSVLFLDLDGFKAVNDRTGHDAGDQLLVSIAQDLRAAIRPTDTLARIGGDEFVVLLEHDDGQEDLHELAQRLVDAVRRTIPDEPVGLVVSASVGIARVDVDAEPGVRPGQLIDRADSAMYRAKQRGKNRHDVFDDELRYTTEARQALEQAVREGLHDGRAELVFQPVVDVDRDTVVGAEALLRIRDASGQLLPTLPAVVAAESAGLAEALSDTVLDLALRAAKDWPEDMSVAVNVSARELSSRGLPARVAAALTSHDVAASRLVLEVTETSILNAGRSILAELDLLRRSGVRIAIDDFGTAYATLRSLTSIPVDILKVDASFTAGLPGERTHSAVVHGVASMAAELGIPCIVEGVENEAQLEAITGMGLQAQGWWWGDPQGEERVPWLASPVAGGAAPGRTS
ncbi:MAG: EAL domain-containing protein [Actinomycetales bacterium]|nr:MAG: EAL domain-containing protein [Actinomycetales bacterium]